MSNEIGLGHFELMLGRVSAFTSHFSDCYDNELYVEVDEYLVENTRQIKGSIEYLQDVLQKDYQETINQLNKMLEGFEKAQKDRFGCYEIDRAEIEVFADAHSIILDYCESKWEENRAKMLGTQSSFTL